MKTGQAVLFTVLGILAAVAIFCLTVGIASAVNEITFFEQITAWFGSGSSIANGTENPVPGGDEVAQVLKAISISKTTFGY